MTIIAEKSILVLENKSQSIGDKKAFFDFIEGSTTSL